MKWKIEEHLMQYGVVYILLAWSLLGFTYSGMFIGVLLLVLAGMALGEVIGYKRGKEGK